MALRLLAHACRSRGISQVAAELGRTKGTISELLNKRTRWNQTQLLAEIGEQLGATVVRIEAAADVEQRVIALRPSTLERVRLFVEHCAEGCASRDAAIDYLINVALDARRM